MALWVRISTHAPHAGSDLLLGSVRPSCKHFNPRSPCGERHFLIEDDFLPVGISTHAPHAGSDVAPTPTPQPTTISTHAPHAGSDADNVYNAISAGQFQPTLPMRGATNYKPHYWRFCRFQPTLPMRGATSDRVQEGSRDIISTHAPHAGSDRESCRNGVHQIIAPPAPHAGRDLRFLRLW